MHFITRERIHVDRISTAWAIRRFVDPDATFSFVSRGQDSSSEEGIRFDMRGADLTHRRGHCTFEALLEKYELRDPALLRMAQIIRSADLPHEEPAAPEAAGVLAVFDGVRDGSATDEERLQRGFVVCDALFVHCRRNPDAGSDL